MNIESKRLNLFPISNDEMRDLIENETIEELRQAYGEMLQGCLDHPEKRMWYAVWFMELKENPGTIVGDFCFKGVGNDGTVEIGYGLREGFCGNGYMTEALLSISEWALKQDGVKKVIAETTEENEASKKSFNGQDSFFRTIWRGRPRLLQIKWITSCLNTFWHRWST